MSKMTPQIVEDRIHLHGHGDWYCYRETDTTEMVPVCTVSDGVAVEVYTTAQPVREYLQQNGAWARRKITFKSFAQIEAILPH